MVTGNIQNIQQGEENMSIVSGIREIQYKLVVYWNYSIQKFLVCRINISFKPFQSLRLIFEI
jgi:hypothetical protein